MANIEVRNADGKVLHTYEVYGDTRELFTDTHGNRITDQVMFDMAKQNAIDDELVSEDEADQLTFKVLE